MSDKLEAAANAYHNGQPLLMTDAEFDDAVEALRAADRRRTYANPVSLDPPTQGIGASSIGGDVDSGTDPTVGGGR